MKDDTKVISARVPKREFAALLIESADESLSLSGLVLKKVRYPIKEVESKLQDLSEANSKLQEDLSAKEKNAGKEIEKLKKEILKPVKPEIKEVVKTVTVIDKKAVEALKSDLNAKNKELANLKNELERSKKASSSQINQEKASSSGLSAKIKEWEDYSRQQAKEIVSLKNRLSAANIALKEVYGSSTKHQY